jgi:type III restriction enzyme
MNYIYGTWSVLCALNAAGVDHAAPEFRKAVAWLVDIQNALDRPYEPGNVLVDEAKMVRFRNALHEGYSDLNIFERTFAEALDRTRRVWCRNPSQGGFSIPLLDRGSTRSFRPDFLVWVDNYVIAIDPKGDDLFNEDAGRKVFSIDKMEEAPELVIRLVTEGGRQSSPTGLFGKISGTDGYTVWMLGQGRPHGIHCPNVSAAFDVCLRTAQHLRLAVRFSSTGSTLRRDLKDSEMTLSGGSCAIIPKKSAQVAFLG